MNTSVFYEIKYDGIEDFSQATRVPANHRYLLIDNINHKLGRRLKCLYLNTFC